MSASYRSKIIYLFSVIYSLGKVTTLFKYYLKSVDDSFIDNAHLIKRMKSETENDIQKIRYIWTALIRSQYIVLAPLFPDRAEIDRSLIILEK